MELSINMNLDNAAFEEDMNGEIKNALNKLMNKMDNECFPISLFDTNGNKIGIAEINN
jgi:hypothetical protein